jgi:hypothetical protein
VNYLDIASWRDLPGRRQQFAYRALEALPGILLWTAFIGAILLSWLKPVWVAIFIISFDTYWLIRTFYLTAHLHTAYQKLKKISRINWQKKLEHLEAQKTTPKINHIVVIPTYKEGWQVVQETLKALSRVRFPKKRIVVVLGLEQRAGNMAQETASLAQLYFGDRFKKIIPVVHPQNLLNEIPGKASNQTWALKKALNKLPPGFLKNQRKILVTTIDADGQVFPQFFSRLTYCYLRSRLSQKTIFQPVIYYNNHLKNTGFIARALAGSSFIFTLLQQERPRRSTNFSCYSISLKTLKKAGFWHPQVIQEDSRLFWKNFLKFNGDFKITPLFYPVSMDAASGASFWQTLKAQYQQQRRWAWGAGDTAYYSWGFWQNRSISWRKKSAYWLYFTDYYLNWSLAAPLILVLGWLPLALGGDAFNATLLAFNLPGAIQVLLTLAAGGLIYSTWIHWQIIKLHPLETTGIKKFWVPLQWLTMPILFNLLSALPAIDAQTRLMLGIPLTYQASPKPSQTQPALKPAPSTQN